MDDLVQGPDGLPRCGWVTDAEDYIRYHDEEWGRAVRDDRALFEKVSLEAFQSGLSWLTILRKREAFRAAFDGFEPERVAAFGDEDVERLLGDAGIVRNRAKIEATIANAGAVVALADAGRVAHRPDLELRARARGAAGARVAGRRARLDARVHGAGQGAQAPRLPVRGTYHGLRADAGLRPGERPPGRVLRAG